MERDAPTRVIAIEPIPELARAFQARRDWTSWTASGRLTLIDSEMGEIHELRIAWRSDPFLGVYFTSSLSLPE